VPQAVAPTICYDDKLVCEIRQALGRKEQVAWAEVAVEVFKDIAMADVVSLGKAKS